jgi:tetratricopeptide (TPR) repeat protein
LHATASPYALLTTVSTHVRMVTTALGREHTTAERRRLLHNLAAVATFAGRLAYEDLGDALSGRAYYSVAADSARETNDHHTAAIVLGYAAQLAHSEGMTQTALDHLAAALAYSERAPAVAPWLASIQATIHADSGEHASAVEALHRADPEAHQMGPQPHFLLHYGAGHLAAAIGHTHLRASYYAPARDALTAALDQLLPTDRRTRILVLVDLATAELHAGNIPEACRHATAAADLLQRTPYAAGIACLRAFRAVAARPIGSRVLRILDEHLAHLAA